MCDLIAIPLKKPSDVDVIQPLKNLIESRYSTSDKPEDYSQAIAEFGKLRSSAIWRAFEKYESSLDVIYGYYDQLVALESKIPAQELQVPFKWKDAFDKGSFFGAKISLTISSLSYERICVLFNIAALQSAIAAQQSIDNDDGLKLAAKLLQLAAGIFHTLKSSVVQTIQQEPTQDLNPECLNALSHLMLAQAQEIFVFKAIHDEMKDGVIAKLATCCHDLYMECAKFFNKEGVKALWDKDWLNLISAKQSGYEAISYFYQSLVCKANKMIGEEITWLTQSEECFKQAHQHTTKQLFHDIHVKAQRHLAEAQKDNDFIYHERIPNFKSLPSIGKAQLSKILPVPHPMSANFRDLFEDLVPVVVHQALAAYDVRKTEMVNEEIRKLRESTQMLNSVLASLNLPAAIETNESGATLPPSILEKADSVRNFGGISSLETLIHDLPELLRRNQDILNETERMIQSEQDADLQLRQQFKERWNRTPSDKLNDMFRVNIGKYRTIINNAMSADKTIRERFEAHREGMELLSKEVNELQAAVPVASAESGGNLNDMGAVKVLKELMEEVETIKAERDVIESELNSSTTDMKTLFLNALASDGSVNEPAQSMETLGRIYGPLQRQVKESLERQNSLVERIQTANSKFVNDRGAESGIREKMMRKLAEGHDAFIGLRNNLTEGTKFYNELTQLLVVFQNKVSDFCFARKTEKEELLKDLTQESSRASDKVPDVPKYYGEVTPTPDAPAPMAPPATSSLPYPVQIQGMPIPYGATVQTPYPSYVPPPMPQGYNPYATMPYPNAYNFPQGPQGSYHPPPPGHGTYPPRHGYPPNWQ